MYISPSSSSPLCLSLFPSLPHTSTLPNPYGLDMITLVADQVVTVRAAIPQVWLV